MGSEEKSVDSLRAVFEQKSKDQEKPGIIRSSSAGKLVGSDEASKILARVNSGSKLTGRKSDVSVNSKQSDSPKQINSSKQVVEGSKQIQNSKQIQPSKQIDTS